MTQENDKTRFDLEQILNRERENSEAIGLLKTSAADYSEDISELHKHSLKMIDGLERITARMRKEVEIFDSS